MQGEDVLVFYGCKKIGHTLRSSKWHQTSRNAKKVRGKNILGSKKWKLTREKEAAQKSYFQGGIRAQTDNRRQAHCFSTQFYSSKRAERNNKQAKQHLVVPISFLSSSVDMGLGRLKKNRLPNGGPTVSRLASSWRTFSRFVSPCFIQEGKLHDFHVRMTGQFTGLDVIGQFTGLDVIGQFTGLDVIGQFTGLDVLGFGHWTENS